MTRTRREVLSVFLGDPNQKHLAKSLSCVAVLMLALSNMQNHLAQILTESSFYVPRPSVPK